MLATLLVATAPQHHHSREIDQRGFAHGLTSVAESKSRDAIKLGILQVAPMHPKWLVFRTEKAMRSADRVAGQTGQFVRRVKSPRTRNDFNGVGTNYHSHRTNARDGLRRGPLHSRPCHHWHQPYARVAAQRGRDAHRLPPALCLAQPNLASVGGADQQRAIDGPIRSPCLQPKRPLWPLLARCRTRMGRHVPRGSEKLSH